MLHFETDRRRSRGSTVGHLSLDVEVRFDVVLGAEKLVEKRALPSHRVDVEQGLALLFFNVGARVVLE